MNSSSLTLSIIILINVKEIEKKECDKYTLKTSNEFLRYILRLPF